MMSDNALMIGITICRDAIDESDGIEDRLRAAMRKVVTEGRILTSEDLQFRAAIGAVMESYGEGSDEWDRLSAEVKILGQMGAMIAAAQAGLQVSLPEMDDDYEPIGVMNIWREIRSDA